MATKRKNSSKRTVDFKGFFNIYLTAEQRDDIAGRLGLGWDVFASLEAALTAGFKVSFSYRGDSGQVICAVYANSTGTDDDGWGFNSWGDDVSKALTASMYKLVYVVKDKPLIEFADLKSRLTDGQTFG